MLRHVSRIQWSPLVRLSAASLTRVHSTLSLHDALPISTALYAAMPPEIPTTILTGAPLPRGSSSGRSEEHTSELQSLRHLVCRLLLEKKKPRSEGIHAWSRGVCSIKFFSYSGLQQSRAT